MFIDLIMEKKLIDISTGELLQKFGAGNHKPGSGSASALQGMLSAQLILTVIDLTNDPNDPKRKESYSAYIPKLLKIKQEIDSRIYVALEGLFQLDSEEFDKVIKLREARDNEQDEIKKKKLAEEATDALVVSTETPIEIAELCLELATFANYVFDHGFRSARGDSGVAINSAVSAVASCLSIIELNLISLPINERTEKIRQRKSAIRLKYDVLYSNVNRPLNILEKKATQNREFHESITIFQKGNLADSVKTNADIEEIVRKLQNTLWLQRERIWKKETINNPKDVLKPDVVLEKVMNYTYFLSASLGTHSQGGEIFEIAGLIDTTQKLVRVSKKFPQETQNFTAAHELGHAILHRQTVMHRDRPLDGSTIVPKTLEETQADKFATYFLMPSRMVEEIFFEFFKTPKFVINQNTVFAIKGESIQIMRKRCQNRRGLARLLASTEFYGNKPFNSLAKIFKVSTETIAIRLEELDLLEF